MRPCRTIGATALVVVVALGAPAAAQPTPVRLVYERGPGAQACPAEAELRDGVTARLGRDPFSAAGPRVVLVSIRRGPHGLIAEVGVRDAAGRPAGERRLASPRTDCAELAGAVGLAIAIAIDPLGAMGPPGDTWEQPASAATGAAPPASAPTAAPAPTTPTSPGAPAAAPRAADRLGVAARTAGPASRPPFALTAGAAALVALGSAPGATAGLALQLALRRGAASLALEGRLDVPREAAVPNVGGTVSGFATTGALVPCGHLGRFALCGVLAAGGLHGAGHGLATPRSDLTPYAALGGRLVAALPLGRAVELRALAELLGTLTPTSLSVGDVAVWRTPPVSGSLGLGLAVRLR